MARREERAYREYVSDEQRSQAGCPARELCDESLLRDTRVARHVKSRRKGSIPVARSSLRARFSTRFSASVGWQANISIRKTTMRTYAAFAIVVAASFSAFACGAMDTRSTRTGTPLTAEKPFD